ncbi:catalase, partial [Enterococcus faecalis]|uniref:catalase n=1 Tax=Enterococcus faecalis TaxID=1351 RepID=UPI003CC55119
SQSMAQYTKADIISEVAKDTPLFARFSTVAGELGSTDTLRDPRGFGLIMFKEQGNKDNLGHNTPLFFFMFSILISDF